MLHKYLSGLDSGISGGIMAAIDNEYLAISTVTAGESLHDIKIACLTDIAKHEAHIKITQGILEAIKSQLAQGDCLTPTPDSNISFDADDEGDDDEDDDDCRIPSVDIQFKSERN
ncbi:hypothetical protein [Chamaesiphon sp.]|uniref:hypothetical protein n=1 Tax=Chamaesiphon sp. TaxID=2814140 RepID=UPI0035932784